MYSGMPMRNEPMTLTVSSRSSCPSRESSKVDGGDWSDSFEVAAGKLVSIGWKALIGAATGAKEFVKSIGKSMRDGSKLNGAVANFPKLDSMKLVGSKSCCWAGVEKSRSSRPRLADTGASGVACPGRCGSPALGASMSNIDVASNSGKTLIGASGDAPKTSVV